LTLDRIWAGWRSHYVSEVANRAPAADGCFLCDAAALPDPGGAEDGLVLERTAQTVTVMNLYPYGSGHLLVAPRRHEPELAGAGASGDGGLDEAEAAALMVAIQRAVRAVREAYDCDGVNVGFNIGRAAGAGVPGHLHAHVLPRWSGDTNFMTAIAETRVLPEALGTGWQKLRAVWPVA
jgi:ATP adenylyltransferase